MRCPLCHAPLHEQSPHCPNCQFDLEAAERAFGMPPPLQVPLTDLAEVLTKHEKGLIQKDLLSFSLRFPQSLFHVVITRLPAQQNLPSVVFWLFNKGSLCAAMEKAGDCHDVLLLLDVEHHRAACIIGYGLEPLIGQEPVDRIAQAALPELLRQQPRLAIAAAVDVASSIFASACEAAPRIFGLRADSEETLFGDESFAY